MISQSIIQTHRGYLVPRIFQETLGGSKTFQGLYGVMQNQNLLGGSFILREAQSIPESHITHRASQSIQEGRGSLGDRLYLGGSKRLQHPLSVLEAPRASVLRIPIGGPWFESPGGQIYTPDFSSEIRSVHQAVIGTGAILANHTIYWHVGTQLPRDALDPGSMLWHVTRQHLQLAFFLGNTLQCILLYDL